MDSHQTSLSDRSKTIRTLDDYVHDTVIITHFPSQNINRENIVLIDNVPYFPYQE